MIIGIISKYPPSKKRHTEDGALAGYTKNLVDNLKIEGDIIVYADKLVNSPECYYDNNVLIRRVWKRGALFFVSILKKLLEDKPEILHVQHEFFLYGGPASALSFLLLLVGAKLLRRKIVVTIHGIVPLSQITIDFVRGNNSILPLSIVRFVFWFLTRTIQALADSTIVHEPKFRTFLVRDYDIEGKKCSVIPHGVEEVEDAVSHDEALEKLKLRGKKVILHFGYIVWYKGIEILLEAFRILHSSHGDYYLIVAGGEHPRYRGQREYDEYVRRLKERAGSIAPEAIRFTGFLAEDEVPVYFAAADVVVFPYTVGMASSGAMSLALAYGRPFIVSDAFRDVVGEDEAVFERTPASLSELIERALDDKTFREKLIAISQNLAGKRSWRRVGQLTNDLYKKLAVERRSL